MCSTTMQGEFYLGEHLYEMSHNVRVFEASLDNIPMNCHIVSGELDELQLKLQAFREWRALSARLPCLSTIHHLYLDEEAFELRIAYIVGPRRGVELEGCMDVPARTAALLSLTKTLDNVESQGLVPSNLTLQSVSFNADFSQCWLHPTTLSTSPLTTDAKRAYMQSYGAIGMKIMACQQDAGTYDLSILLDDDLVIVASLLEACLISADTPCIHDCLTLLNNLQNTSSQWLSVLFVLSNFLREGPVEKKLKMREEVNQMKTLLFGAQGTWRSKLPKEFYDNFFCYTYSDSVESFIRCVRNLKSHLWQALANGLGKLFEEPYMPAMEQFWRRIAPQCFPVLLLQCQSDMELRKMLSGVVGIPSYLFRPPHQLTKSPGVFAYPSLQVERLPTTSTSTSHQSKKKTALSSPIKTRKHKQQKKRKNVPPHPHVMREQLGLFHRVGSALVKPWRFLFNKLV